jgi:hypothetical protein
MALADDIRVLRDRVQLDLNFAHDYYSDTRTAWEIVNEFAAAGNTFFTQNLTTGTETTQADLPRRAVVYVAVQLAEATFQQFISIFENFFFDLLRLWLSAYPQNLSGKKVDVKAILDAPDKETILQFIVDREVNEIMYDRPTGWFAYFESMAKIGCPTADEIDRIAEAKACRDVLAHNRGVSNKVYVSKAGKLARFKEGQRIDITEQYHQQTWELIRKVATDISNASIAKFP